MKLLITGGCGFIGSNFVRLAFRELPGLELVNLDLLTYAGNPASLADVAAEQGEKYRHIKVNIADQAAVDAALSLAGASGFDALVNFAAESHVDRSINSPEGFITTNVTGTMVMLETARRLAIPTYVQVSTDEVYGSLGPEGKFTETTPLDPSSPYSASKASADLLALAYEHTFGMDVRITRCSNNYGPYQFPEKLIPLMIVKALADQPLPVYGDGLNVRDWIHVEDHCRAVLAVLLRGKAGEVYNIGADGELPNIEVVKTLLRHLGKPESLITYVQDRLGHDRRYAIDSSKIHAELGWKPLRSPEEGFADTVRWYLANEDWWRPLLKK
jgi:dTDP-glucose 4,6-dehydratase